MTRLAKPWEQTLYPDLRHQKWGQPCLAGLIGEERCNMVAELWCPVPFVLFPAQSHILLCPYFLF